MSHLDEVRKIDDPVRQLVRVMEILRSPEGCPWDRKQTHETLTRYLQEECAEAVDAATAGDYAGLCDELGDLLMNLVFNSVVAVEEGKFTFDDVARGSVAKMIRRHPHVFGDSSAETAEQVLAAWEEIKKTEENRPVRESVLDGVPRSLCPLARADKMQRKAAAVGFDWPDLHLVLDKIDEEIAEIREAVAAGDEDKIDEEFGDLLFSLVNFTRFRKRRTADELLRDAIAKFDRRFRHVEQAAAQAEREMAQCSPDELDAWWNEAKQKGL